MWIVWSRRFDSKAYPALVRDLSIITDSTTGKRYSNVISTRQIPEKDQSLPLDVLARLYPAEG